ncbi:MAG TPA: septal ring lytic transglycosylase RlpA family protein [Bryobacteraceae bacterium]|nr:septal ring lytic transglycosylase RlpA family protein [Bryobacteraceae bacterium]
MQRRVSLIVALALVLLSGCAKKKRVAAPPIAPRTSAALPHVGDEESGIASWYGHPYHGRASSSGEIYDMEKLTAAHRTLPFGTVVEVRDLDNGRTVSVRINDRGPFVEGRIIDLSHAAAREIQMLGPGTANVRLRIASLPSSIPDGYFAVQTGAFRERANAERQRLAIERRYGSARLLLRGDPPLWRVMAGHASTIADASALAARIQTESGPAFVVRVDAPSGD